MTMTQFLDQYISGESGYWYFALCDEIQGGAYYRKVDARRALLSKIMELLEQKQHDNCLEEK